jgi:hypothetical protein
MTTMRRHRQSTGVMNKRPPMYLTWCFGLGCAIATAVPTVYQPLTWSLILFAMLALAFPLRQAAPPSGTRDPFGFLRTSAGRLTAPRYFAVAAVVTVLLFGVFEGLSRSGLGRALFDWTIAVGVPVLTPVANRFSDVVPIEHQPFVVWLIAIIAFACAWPFAVKASPKFLQRPDGRFSTLNYCMFSFIAASFLMAYVGATVCGNDSCSP